VELAFGFADFLLGMRIMAPELDYSESPLRAENE
jgi:hypothetical protein